MDILAQRLQGRLDKDQILETARWCVADQARYDALLGYMVGPDDEIGRRAAWIYQHAVDMYPEGAATHVGAMVDRLNEPAHPGIWRGIMRSLQRLPIPKEYHMPLMDRAFEILDNPQIPVAIRAFSMTVLERLVLPYPELCRELSLIIEAHLPEGSAGFKSRGKKTLKNLRRRL